MTTTNTVTINEIPVDSTDSTKTAWGTLLSNQYYFVIANGTAAAETFDAADISAATKTLMGTYKRGISVNMGAGDDTVIGSGFGDTINAGGGTNFIDGGANEGTMPGGAKARDVLNVFAADQAAADLLGVTAIDAGATGADGAAYTAGYRIKVSNGTETDYLKNVEQVNVFLAGTNTYVKTIRLAMDVHEIDGTQQTANAMHMAWAQGSGFADTFNAATDVSAATQALMTQNKRGVWVDAGAGDDSITGSGFGDDINAGSGTNYVDGGDNAGSPPWGGKAVDALHVTVATQAAADAVTVVQLTGSATGVDAQAFASGYTHKVTAGAETDYVKGIERVSVEVKTSNGSTWARDIPLTVVVHEANLGDSNIANYYHLAWANGTAGNDTIDMGGDSALLSAELKAALAARGRGVWVDGGAGNDTITGTAYADNFRNGAGNSKIDGGANAGPSGAKGQDVFEITVSSSAEMAAVQVVASDDSAYQWMVTYGSGSTQKDYLKNIEAIVVNVAGTSTGRWIPLAINVHEIQGTADLDKSMHFAWAQGTAQDDNFNAGTDISATTRTAMGQKGRGVWADLGAGNDTAVGSGYGDDFNMGAGTNYVDGGDNAGSPPWGGKAADVLHVTVAAQAAADAVTVTELGTGLTGTDAQARDSGYTHKVVAGTEIDYIKGIERVSVQVDTGNGGSTWARDIPLAVVVHEANLGDSNSANYYHLAWANGTAGNDTVDLGADSALLSAELKAALAARGRGVWVDGGAGNDTITGTAYADNFRNGAGNSKVDGGANAGPSGAKGQDVFEITVASSAEMGAIQVVASDDSAYQWMVTYGSGSTQKDYLKNIEAVVVNVAGTGSGRWIPLAINVHEIQGTADQDKSMHFAWAQGTAQDDNFNAGIDISAATRTAMGQKGRGVWADLGAGNDTAVGSGYGDDFNMGAGTNYVDGGANEGSPPWGGKAADVLRVTVASQAAADAVTVTVLGTGLTGTDAQARDNGYTHKVVAGAEIDYIKGIERISIQVDTGNGGSTWARDIPLAVVVQEANLSDTNIANYHHLAWVNGTAGGETIDLGADSTLLSAELKAALAARGRGVWVDGGAGNDTITGTAYADNFRNGAGNAKIDGGANGGPAGAKGQDVFEITVASSAEMNAVQVVASDDSAYQWMVTYGAGSTQKDYLKNIEAVVVNVAGTSTGKWIALAMTVQEIAGTANLDQSMHFAWAQGSAQDDSFNAGTDISAATKTLMGQKGRGVWADLGAGSDSAVGSGYGDDFNMGAGTNYVDGGANAGTNPFGNKAADVLHVTVASQAAADAVAVTALGAGLTGTDAQAFANGYTHKVTAGAETDYIRNIERVAIEIDNGSGGITFARDIVLVVTVHEADLASPDIDKFHTLASVNGTAAGETIDLSGDTPLLSSALKAAMAARGRGVYVDGGAGDDVVTGSAYADDFQNGAGNARIDGGANAGPAGQQAKDVFRISVASSAEMDAIRVVASDDANYSWMVTYGAGSTQKDYLKNIEAVSINVTGASLGKWIPLALDIHEIDSGADLAGMMHFAWANGTGADESFNAGTDLSAATRTKMAEYGRGIHADMGAGNDTVVGSAYGDNIVAGAGTNYVDGGANTGTPPGGGTAMDVLDVFVANQAAADALTVTELTATMGGADGAAYAAGYRVKVTNGTAEVDYVRNIERIQVGIWDDKNGDGQRQFYDQSNPANEVTWVRSVTPPAAAPLTPNTAPSFAGVAPGIAVTDAGKDFGAIGGTVLASGKMLALSYFKPEGGEYVLVLNRSNADGSVDTGFGTGGKVQVPTSYNSVAAPVELSNGQVLVGVSTFGAAGDFRVLRLNADGSLDTTFGSGGSATVSLGSGADQLRKLVVDGSGKIVAVGGTNSDTGRDIAVVRLTADGALDTSFNGTGKATVSLAAGTNSASTVAVQADGKLVVVGSAPTATAGVTQLAVLRMNSDGTLDGTFGNGGKLLLPLGAGTSYGNAVQVLADGRILIGGSAKTAVASTSDWDPALVMLSANGTLDAGFGDGGIARAHPSDLNDTVSGIQVQADGKILILGTVHYAGSGMNGALLVARYNANGTPDFSFGDNGAVVVSAHGIADQPSSLAVAGGKIVIFGSAVNDTSFNTSNIIVRLNLDGTPDTSFGAANPSSLGATVRGTGIVPVVLDANAAIFDAELAARGNYGGASLTLARQGGQNAEDLFLGVGEVRLADGNVSVGGIVIGSAVQSGGKLDLLFNEQATQGLVNRALHGIGYANASAAAPASVVIGWTFSDNNSGAQGSGGALGASGSTTVEIGVVTSEVKRALADPALTAEHGPLTSVAFVGNAFGTAAADTFDSASGFTAAARGLMDQLQRGARFDMGPGNDTVTGTAYSDEFTLGAGVNRVDGGGQAGAHPYGGAGRDVLQVYVASDADGAAVNIALLDASATGADKEALDAGFNVKVTSGAETDYAKNIENVAVIKWNDANGNKLRDAGETTYLRDFSLALRVHEVQVSTTDPARDTGGNLLSGNMHFAWAYGWSFADSFNANTDVSASTRALMVQYGRGIYVDTGAGDDAIVGSGYGDNIQAGSGVNRIDGGANAGTNPHGGMAYDDLTIYTSEPGKVAVTVLAAGMSGADADAFAAGYTYKIFAGAEIDYVKNIESVSVFGWSDANGNGVRDPNEVSWSHRIGLAMLVNEVRASATDPTRDEGGNPLSTYAHFAWVDGTATADSFSVEANVSAPTRALMAQQGRGIYAQMGAGDDVVSGSNWADYIIAGGGTNKIDGGANLGFDQNGYPSADTLQMLVADQAAADATTVTMLTASMTGADAAAYTEGYRFKIANGTAEVNYVKNVENLDIVVWQDKNGNGRPDYGGDGNEVTGGRYVRLSENTAPTFSAQPGVAVTDSGYDLTTYGFTVLADGKLVSLSIADTVAEGNNYTSVLTRHNTDGSLDASFGSGGAVFLPVTFGVPSRPLGLADGKLLMAVSTNLSNTADFKVVRLNANGTVDTTFGNNGEAVVSLSDGNDVPRKMLAQADGKVLVTGSVNGNADFGVIRLNADGSLDTSFNGNGKLVVPLADGPDSVMSAVLQADGKLLLAGYSGSQAVRDFALVRVNTDGTLDTGFGSGGKLVLPVGPGTDGANAIAVQADGKIVLGGVSRTSADTTSDTDLSLVRLKADGSLDTSFGDGGKVVLHQSAANDGIGEVLVQPDGKIVTAGWKASGTGEAVLTVMRFNSDGSLDTAFARQGVASTAVHGVDARPAGLALVDGKIVVSASSYFNLNFDASLVLVRLNLDGSFDTSFGVGRSSVAGTVKSDGLHPVVLDMNALVYDAEMAANNDYGGASVTLARRGGANPEDVFSAAGEVAFEAGRVKVAGMEVGWIEQGGGSLTLHFHGGTSQGMLDRALHGIAYANSSANPPASVIIDWLFSDNNPGWQGMGGSLSASGSTTVQIGVVVQEAVRAYADPALAADGRALSGILHLATVNGTAHGDQVSGALVSTGGRTLMDEFKRGVVFDTGAGNDVITGSAYGDLFVGGAGVNRIDGGTNLGTDPSGAPAIDVLDVFVTDAAVAAGVSPVLLSGSMSGADLDAFNAGYTHKLVVGAETDYFKGIESVRIWSWQDRDGDGVRDVSSDANVNEVTLVGTPAIAPVV